MKNYWGRGKRLRSLKEGPSRAEAKAGQSEGEKAGEKPKSTDRNVCATNQSLRIVRLGLGV